MHGNYGMERVPDMSGLFHAFKNTLWFKTTTWGRLYIHSWVFSMYNRYPKNFFRDLLRSSVLVCLDKIKFRIFFAFVILDYMAWLNRLGPSNFYFIDLFFVPLNPP